MRSLKQIIVNVSPIKIIGNENKQISGLFSIENISAINDQSLLWLNTKNAEKVTVIKSGTIICGPEVEKYQLNENCTYIIVDDPRKVFAEIIKEFFSENENQDKIESTSVIDKDVRIGKNVYIGHHNVIEKGTIIGNFVYIGHNNVIKKNTIIDCNVRIGSNNTIGEMGFGYEKDEHGRYFKIHHIGNVHIEEGVEISNNICIDRAVLGTTRIRKNVKIDNLVHVAHNVDIGENSLIIANSMIGGSVKIGENTWVAPSSSILNQLNLGEGSVIGMGSVVIKNVEPYTVVAGNPSRFLKKKS